jgi:hypothetical protein
MTAGPDTESVAEAGGASHRIEGYRNVPGQHCGSTAMRNLTRHYCGLELSEAMVFGLGSGLHFLLLETELYEPGVLMFGRTATMEVDYAEALGLHYTEQVEADDAKAWRVVREEVLAGRPTMLSGDALYLDYRDFKVHFPAHRFVLLGFDDEVRKALVADRIDEAAQPCAYEALAASRNPKDFISTWNLWGKFHDGRVGRTLSEACAIAIPRAARRLLDNDLGGVQVPEGGAVTATGGLAGLDRLAERLPDFLARPSGKALARYAAACIESFGTGGGNFRVMTSAFLQEVHDAGFFDVRAEEVEAMRESARTWTSLSDHLRAFSVGEEDGMVDAAVAAVIAIRDTEARLFERLVRKA